jgi:hypothetical protein
MGPSHLAKYHNHCVTNVTLGSISGKIIMLFRLVNAEYDPDTQRAYVEFRTNDDDGGEIITTAIFTYS